MIWNTSHIRILTCVWSIVPCKKYYHLRLRKWVHLFYWDIRPTFLHISPMKSNFIRRKVLHSFFYWFHLENDFRYWVKGRFNDWLYDAQWSHKWCQKYATPTLLKMSFNAEISVRNIAHLHCVFIRSNTAMVQKTHYSPIQTR